MRRSANTFALLVILCALLPGCVLSGPKPTPLGHLTMAKRQYASVLQNLTLYANTGRMSQERYDSLRELTDQADVAIAAWEAAVLAGDDADAAIVIFNSVLESLIAAQADLNQEPDDGGGE